MDGKVIKISQKIGLQKFVALLKQKPEKVVISQSILDQTKSLKLMTEAIQSAYKNPVKIEVVKRGETPVVIEQDWIDPFIRSMIGFSPPKEITLELKLLDKNATSKGKAVSIQDLSRDDRKLLNNLIKMEHVFLTSEAKVYLTELGGIIARGAKKIYSQ